MSNDVKLWLSAVISNGQCIIIIIITIISSSSSSTIINSSISINSISKWPSCRRRCNKWKVNFSPAFKTLKPFNSISRFISYFQTHFVVSLVIPIGNLLFLKHLIPSRYLLFKFFMNGHKSEFLSERQLSKKKNSTSILLAFLSSPLQPACRAPEK